MPLFASQRAHRNDRNVSYRDDLPLLFRPRLSCGEELIAELSGSLEVEIRTRDIHLEFETFDVDFDIRDVSAIECVFFLRWDGDFFDTRDDGLRSDTVLRIVRELDGTTPVGLGDSIFHGDGFFASMRVHDDVTIYITSGTTDDLEE